MLTMLTRAIQSDLVRGNGGIAQIGRDVGTSQHVPIPSRHLFLTDIEWFPRFVHNGPVTVHDAVGWHCGMIRGALEFEVGCKFAVHCAWKADTASSQSTNPCFVLREMHTGPILDAVRVRSSIFSFLRSRRIPDEGGSFSNASKLMSSAETSRYRSIISMRADELHTARTADVQLGSV